MFRAFPFVRYTFNTLTYAVLATVGVVLSSIPVAYALARLRWRGRQTAFLLVLATLMLPPGGRHRPAACDLRAPGMGRPLKLLIIPLFFGDAFSIFLLRQFFLTIPQELSDAARVDGASDLQILTRVIVAAAGDRGGGAVPVPLLLERLLQPAAVRGQQPRELDAGGGPDPADDPVARGAVDLQMAGAPQSTIPVIIVFLRAQKVPSKGSRSPGSRVDGP